jgi:predicted XRE-type DNA-binding protein
MTNAKRPVPGPLPRNMLPSPIYIYTYNGMVAAIMKKSEPRTKTKLTKRTPSSKRVTEGSGNVFADLGLPNADQELLKAQLTLQIYRIIKQRGLTQTQAAKALGIKQPHVSLLMRNRAGTFSVGRLIDFLTALGQDVAITVRPTRKERGEMSVALV